MIVVLPFCSKDADLMRRNLEWCLELDAGCGREGVLAFDNSVPPETLSAIETLAARFFTKVHKLQYGEPPVKGWPAACNWAWQETARWMFQSSLKQPWLWLEADAMPLKSGWVLTLEKAHQEGGKNFGGHIVKDMGHMNGVGIYPWDVMRRNEMAMLTRAAAWDVVLKPNVEHDCVRLNHLIQHAWNVHPQDRAMIWNGEGQPVSFKSQADVDLYLDFNAVLMHRIKDGSLIPLLRERHLAAQEKERLIQSTEYNVPQHTKQNEANESAASMDGFRGEKGQRTVVAGDLQQDFSEKPVAKSGAKTHILIVTYYKDADWLRYCLALCNKYLTGFSGITVAYPSKDKFVLSEIVGNARARSWHYDEAVGKGMVQHMAVMALADTIVPQRILTPIVDVEQFVDEEMRLRKHSEKGREVLLGLSREAHAGMAEIASAYAGAKTKDELSVLCSHLSGSGASKEAALFLMREHKVGNASPRLFASAIRCVALSEMPSEFAQSGASYVMHLDADCMFHTPTTPADYFTDGRPDYLVRTWESLTDPASKVVSDCAQWIVPTEKQLGFRPKMYTMCRHPTVFPVSFYKSYREWVEAEHKKPFMEYMISGRNEFPQDRMDWTAMGAFAYEFMRPEFNWIDIGAAGAVVPKDRQKTYWSHGGLKPEIKAEIDGWLK